MNPPRLPRKIARRLGAALLCAALWGCGSVSSSPADLAPADRTPDHTPDRAAAPDGPAARDLGPDAPDAGARDLSLAPDLGGPVTSCAAVGSNECFGNVDCKAGQRCQNLGSAASQVPCCITGDRGKGAAGAGCKGELDCQSGVCIAKSGPYLCSRTCKADADCPAGMKDCKAVAFSGSSYMWCFPEK